MSKGNAERRHFLGAKTPCRSCGTSITVTEKMLAYSKYICGPCQSSRSVAWAKANRDKKRASNNAHHAKISAKRAPSTRAYRARYPERRAAHQAVQTATRNGSLVRKDCSVCGATKTHAHHDDYSKPLDVVWLCHAHHMERHSMLAERSKELKS